MNEIVEAISSPVWWASVVVAGFLVNIIAAYAKPVVDRLLSAMSGRYRVWSEDRKQRIGKVSYYLLEHPQEASDLRGQVLHLTLKMLLVIVSGCSIYSSH